MSETWDGKTKGGLNGYKIFVFLLQKFGLNTAYVLLFFMSCLFGLFCFQQKQVKLNIIYSEKD